MTNQSREDDDQATGLPDLPKLIFLDTNIVQNLHSFGEFIYDRVSTPDLEKKLSTLGPRVTADIYALADFMALQAGWDSVRPLDHVGRQLLHFYATAGTACRPACWRRRSCSPTTR